MIPLDTIMIIIGLLSIIVVFYKWLHKISTVSMSLGKWFVFSLAMLVLAWGLYNYIGVKFQLWEPLSLDAWINALAERLHLKWLLDNLNKIFRW